MQPHLPGWSITHERPRLPVSVRRCYDVKSIQRNYSEDAVIVWMVSFVAQLIDYHQGSNDRRTDTKAKSADVNPYKKPVSDEVPPGSDDIISKHEQCRLEVKVYTS